METMKKDEIQKLDDKDLQLRYFLGGLKNINDRKEHLCDYWTCDINCSTTPVPDDENLDAVKRFIKKHNITNERFLRLSYNYIIGATMKYNGMYSQLFLELEEVIKPYNFIRTNKGQIPDNTFREKELEKLVINAYDSDSIVGDYIRKYNLTVEDFIILAKTSLNHNLYGLQVSNPDDTFTSEIVEITHKYGLNVTRDYIVKYREEYKNKEEAAELIIETKTAQKKYLELMKELLIKDYASATELIRDELKELGVANKKDIKRLIRKK